MNLLEARGVVYPLMLRIEGLNMHPRPATVLKKVSVRLIHWSSIWPSALTYIGLNPAGFLLLCRRGKKLLGLWER